ncbi:MAG: hypothetical protein AB1585_11370 [Thermodesulfobacteriota bacterium]
MKKIVVSGILAAMLVMVLVGLAMAETAKGKAAPAAATLSAAEFKSNMKRLWLENVSYSRNFIISSLADLPDLPKLKERLDKNQADIAGEFKTFFGDIVAENVAAILKKHSAITEEIIKVVNKGTQEQFLEINAKWEANAEELAEFLNIKIPKIAKQTFSNLFYKQLTATSGQIVARVKKDWDSDYAYFDKGLVNIQVVADTLADGLVKQFPNKFKK